nr:centromere protein O [Tanacetum cinerariifolium]
MREIQRAEDESGIEAGVGAATYTTSRKVCLIKDLYGNQIRELYHSLPYHMIEFVVDDTMQKDGKMAFAEIALNLPDAIDPSSQSKDSSSS